MKVRRRVGLVAAGAAVACLVVGVASATPGDLDTTFGTGGKVLTDFGSSSNDIAQAVAVQEDGKIVVAGYSDANGGYEFAVSRYTRTGAPDMSFGSGGKVLTDVGGGGNDNATAIAVQKDGKIVVAGFSAVSGGYDFALVRYTKTGALDKSFGSNGKVLTDLGSTGDFAYAVAIQKDGKIVVAGKSFASGSGDFAVVRYTKRGAVDTRFGSSGVVLTDIGSASNDGARALALQKDGKIVAAGSTNASGGYDFALVRYTKTGALDTGFGPGGKVVTDLGGSNDGAYAVALQKDGEIVAGGDSNVNGSNDFALVRYTTAGAVDTGFGTGGQVVTDLGSSSSDCLSGIALQKDEKILAGGNNACNDKDFALARYTTTGALDTSFGSGGIALTDIGSSSSDYLYALALQQDGKAVAVGYSDASGGGDFAVVRYLG